MQGSKQGLWKEYHLSIEGIRKGDLFREKWYIKGKGLDLGAEPPCINILLSTPRDLPAVPTVKILIKFMTQLL